MSSNALSRIALVNVRRLLYCLLILASQQLVRKMKHSYTYTSFSRELCHTNDKNSTYIWLCIVFVLCCVLLWFRRIWFVEHDVEYRWCVLLLQKSCQVTSMSLLTVNFMIDFDDDMYGYLPSPDSKVHGAKMGPAWVLSAPDGPHVGTMNLAIRVLFVGTLPSMRCLCNILSVVRTSHICMRGMAS